MGISSKKSKTTTDQKTTATVTPTNPDFVTNSVSGLSDKIGKTFDGLDPYSLVAGPDPLQMKAAQSAGGLGAFNGYGGAHPRGEQPMGGLGVGGKAGGGSAGTSPLSGLDAAEWLPPPKTGSGGGLASANIYTSNGGPGAGAGGSSTGDPFADAMNAMRGYSQGDSVQPASLLDGLDGYMNPYLDKVVKSSLADYDYGAGRQEGQANLDLGQDTTYGGSSGSLYKSALGGEIARGRGALSSGLYKSGFDTATGLSNLDAQRRQDASTTNAGIGLAGAQGLATTASAQQENKRSNVAAQNQMGEILRQIEEARRRAPVAALGLQQSLISGLPYDLFKGQNATGSLTGTTTSKESGASLGDWMGFMAANANAAAKSMGGA